MSSQISRRVLARTVASKLIAEPARRDHWVRALAAYLVDSNRAAEAELVMNDIAHELLEQNGTLLVDVTSARPLTDVVRKELTAYMQEATGAREVQFAEHVEPQLIGGFIARTPGQQLDTSVHSQLRQLTNIA